MTTLNDLGLRGKKKDGLNRGELHHSVLFIFMLGIIFRDFLNFFIYLFIYFVLLLF
jgi:hypothetical protein